MQMKNKNFQNKVMIKIKSVKNLSRKLLKAPKKFSSMMTVKGLKCWSRISNKLVMAKCVVRLNPDKSGLGKAIF